MLLQDSRILPIPGANAGWDYEYGLDSLRRLSYLKQFVSGIGIQPIIVPNRFSYITRTYDFAGPIVGFYIGKETVTESLLNGADTVSTQDLTPDYYTSSVGMTISSILKTNFKYLSDSELDQLLVKILSSGKPENLSSGEYLSIKPINFWENFEAGKREDLKTKMMYLPRYAVEEMIWEMLKPNYSGINSGDNGIYKATAEELRRNIPLIRAALTDISQAVIISNMLHLFNEANIEAMTVNNISDPYAWEKRKSDAYQKKDIDADLSKAVFNVLSPDSAKIYSERQDLIRSFEKRVESLPQLKDKAIQLQRDTALAGFLAQENFEELNLLLYYYENLPSNIKQAMLEV